MSKSLRFDCTVVCSGYKYKSLFSARETIPSLVQSVIISNATLREHDVEQFKDDPLKFIRLDIPTSASGTDLATWINSGLAESGSNETENRKVLCTC